MAAALLVSLSAAAAATMAPRPAPIAVSRIVMPGDTLWDLATECRSDQDRRQLIWVLQEVNGLRSATLRPGQSLLLPIGEWSVRDAMRAPRDFRTRALRISELDVATALAGER